MRALALLLNIITIAAALAVTVWLVPGVNYTGPNKLLVDESFDPAIALGIVAIAFMLVNSTVGPLVRTVGAPINCLTLGLFSFFVNIAILWLAGAITNAVNIWGTTFTIDGFWSATFGAGIFALARSIVAMITSPVRARG
ncbi:phage holin family protein [Corynebacterium pseudodiphtheriticum]|uniref:phage holin family protein n=1 Tax=Corynebacterium pseudodiphtheriticum TaxID=37637 RepID=UPI003B63A25B